jgi:hypothetical protein
LNSSDRAIAALLSAFATAGNSPAAPLFTELS